MAIDEDRRDFPSATGLAGRLRGAWRVLRGQDDAVTSAEIVRAPGRALAHPQTLLIEQLIAGFPSAAIVLDRESRVIAFNDAATGIAPALRRGEPALIALRMPDLVDAIRRAAKRGEPQRVEFFERVPLDRWFEAFVTPLRLSTGVGARDRRFADDVQRSHAAAPGRGDARRLHCQRQPRVAHAACGIAWLHRNPSGHCQGRLRRARKIPCDHARASDPHGPP